MPKVNKKTVPLGLFVLVFTVAALAIAGLMSVKEELLEAFDLEEEDF